MNIKSQTSDRMLELMLVLTTISLGAILYSIEQFQVVVLNLFFMPVVMAGFFLGRYRAGILALLSVVVATMVISLDLERFSSYQSPAVVALSVMVWGAILGLTSIIIGTLNEERNARAKEVHEAHVGVVEVLARCLQSADPELQNRANRVDRLAEQVAIRMRMTPREVDEVRVAALLMDLSNIEITARVIKRAVGELGGSTGSEECTFHGSELVNSLGTALSGAFPLVLIQSVSLEEKSIHSMPIGARILRIVRRFVNLTDGLSGPHLSSEDALEELGQDHGESHDQAVLNVLYEVVHSDWTEVAHQAAMHRVAKMTEPQTLK